MPPHIAISDLAFPFPCPSECFRVGSAEAFLDTAKRDYPDYWGKRQTHICHSVKALGDANTWSIAFHPPAVTELGGFILISGMKSDTTFQASKALNKTAFVPIHSYEFYYILP